MNHHYADDGRILTPPKELEPLLKGAFPAFTQLLSHIRFFYIADEAWDGIASFALHMGGKPIAEITLADGAFDIRIEKHSTRVLDDSVLDTLFAELETIAAAHRRPAESLAINADGFPCGYRCDLCILNRSNNENGAAAGDAFGYLNWVCYHNCLDGIRVDRFDSTGHSCPGCEAVRASDPRYCKYINCASERGYRHCVACGNHHHCETMRGSHHPGQCSLGLRADEVTKLIIPYHMKWRLDRWRDAVMKERKVPTTPSL
jgi:hypothetical protein